MDRESRRMGEWVVSVVRVQIERSESGLLFATSPTLPGLCLAHRDENFIRQSLPEAIKLLFAAQGTNVRVLPARDSGATLSEDRGEDDLMWAAVPAHIADEAMAQAD